MRIDLTNLKAYYQPPLYQEEWPKGYAVNATHALNEKGELVAYRPPKVVGSYAFYHVSKSNNEYTTGKVGHVYYPYIRDSKGWIVRAEDFTLDAKTGIMRITYPSEFMDKAVYPIYIDPTFGKTDIGETNYDLSADVKRGNRFQLTEAGNIISVHIYFTRLNEGGVKHAVYDDDGPDNRASTLKGGDNVGVAIPAGDNWVQSNALSIELTADWWYLVCKTDQQQQWKYDSGSEFRSWSAEDYTDDWASGDFASFDASGDKVFSIYATYTTGGETYERDVDLGLTWTGNGLRTWNLTRVFNLGLDWSGSTTRSWSLTRGLSLELDWSGEAFGARTRIFSRVVSLGIKWASSMSRQVNFNRVSQITVDFTFSLPGLLAKTIRVWVKTLQGTAIEDAVVTLSNPSTGAILWAYYTDSEGYTPQEDLDPGSYLLEVIKEQYQPYNDLFNFTETTVKEVPLRSISGGAFWWFVFFPMFLLGLYMILNRRR